MKLAQAMLIAAVMTILAAGSALLLISENRAIAGASPAFDAVEPLWTPDEATSRTLPTTPLVDREGRVGTATTILILTAVPR